MKHLQLAFLLATTFVYSYSYSQDIVLTDLEDMPAERSAICAAQGDGIIYVANGFSTTEQFTPTVFTYNPSTDIWSVLTSSTIPKMFASSAIVGDNMYLFNGAMDGGALNDQMEIINLNSGAITISTTMNPQPSTSAGTATWNGKIYSFGGSISGGLYSDKVYEFDPLTESWSWITTLPVPQQTDGEIIDGKLYVTGGYNGNVSNKIFIYDIENDAWENEFNMAFGISAHATTAVGSKIFMVGDFANLTWILSYDTENNNFSLHENNMIPRRHCAAEQYNNQFIVIGGNTESDITTAISSVQMTNNVSLIEDYTASPSVQIYPNPTSESINWNVEFDLIIITDAQGKMIDMVTPLEKHLDISKYSNGAYFLSGRKGDQWHYSKWIKE